MSVSVGFSEPISTNIDLRGLYVSVTVPYKIENWLHIHKYPPTLSTPNNTITLEGYKYITQTVAAGTTDNTSYFFQMGNSGRTNTKGSVKNATTLLVTNSDPGYKAGEIIEVTYGTSPSFVTVNAYVISAPTTAPYNYTISDISYNNISKDNSRSSNDSVFESITVKKSDKNPSFDPNNSYDTTQYVVTSVMNDKVIVEGYYMQPNILTTNDKIFMDISGITPPSTRTTLAAGTNISGIIDGYKNIVYVDNPNKDLKPSLLDLTWCSVIDISGETGGGTAIASGMDTNAQLHLIWNTDEVSHSEMTLTCEDINGNAVTLPSATDNENIRTVNINGLTENDKYIFTVNNSSSNDSEYTIEFEV